MSLPNPTAIDAAPLLIRRAQLFGRGRCDVRVAGERIVAVAERLEPAAGERLIDASGGLLLPGLHDHHLHLFATATARASLFCGPPAVADEAALRELLALHYQSGDGWMRGVGFHDSVCAGLDRHWLDRVCPERPLRIQHRSGMLWILNSCALAQLRLAPDEVLPAGVEREAGGAPSGRFFDLDAWLGERLPRAWPSLRELSLELARFGITAATDTGVNNGRATLEALAAASERGEIAQRLLVMGNEELHRAAASDDGAVAIGPLKLYLREAALPDLDELAQRMRAAHDCGRAVAVHCVTRVELYYALAALEQAGARAGDRIEHASVAADAAIEQLAALGVSVVTQPHFIAERGDQYLRDVDADDQPLLYRGAGFLRAGVALAAGSDAPYGATDPWAAMRAAVARRTRDGAIIGADEALTPEQALALFGGDPHRPGGALRELAAGQSADLCLLDLPWPALANDLDASHITLTLCRGRIAYRRADAVAMDD